MKVDALPDEDFLPTEQVGRLTWAEMRGDLPAALRYGVALVVAGVPLGGLWILLAPVVHVVVLPGTGSGSPAGESDHAFDAMAIFVLLVTVFGVLAGAVAWRMRHRRGPVLLAVTVLATLLGAWLAARVGVLLAPAGAPVGVLVDASAIGSGSPGLPVPGTLTATPASPGPWWGVLIAGLAASLTYVLAAIVDGREDMARDPADGDAGPHPAGGQAADTPVRSDTSSRSPSGTSTER